MGGGRWSVASRAELPWPRHFSTAAINIATSDIEISRNWGVQVDIEELVVGAAPTAHDGLARFLASNTQPPYCAGADLVMYSEILNYVDFRQTMRWFDDYLRPGGFTLVANMPGRGYKSLFSDKGVKSNQEVIGFMADEPGHDTVVIEHPWGMSDEDDSFLLMAAQRPAPVVA